MRREEAFVSFGKTIEQPEAKEKKRKIHVRVWRCSVQEIEQRQCKEAPGEALCLLPRHYSRAALHRSCQLPQPSPQPAFSMCVL